MTGLPVKGGEVRKIRLEIGLSQYELAADAGVSRDVIANIELGRTGAPSHVLRKVARALGVKYDEIVGA